MIENKIQESKKTLRKQLVENAIMKNSSQTTVYFSAKFRRLHC